MERICITNAAGEVCSLTLLQAKYAEFLRQFYRSRGFPPSVREIAKNFRVGPGNAHGHLRRLEVKGLIDMSSGEHRGIVLLFDVSVPFCGQVSAGKLTWAEPQTEWLDLKPMFADGNIAAVVEDDSLADEKHIVAGDLVILDADRRPRWVFRPMGWKPKRVDRAASSAAVPAKTGSDVKAKTRRTKAECAA